MESDEEKKRKRKARVRRRALALPSRDKMIKAPPRGKAVAEVNHGS